MIGLFIQPLDYGFRFRKRILGDLSPSKRQELERADYNYQDENSSNEEDGDGQQRRWRPYTRKEDEKVCLFSCLKC